MTRYEELTRKALAFIHPARACADNGDWEMALMWMDKQAALFAIRDTMSFEQASRKVS